MYAGDVSYTGWAKFVVVWPGSEAEVCPMMR